MELKLNVGEVNKEMKDEVLREMLEEGLITQEDVDIINGSEDGEDILWNCYDVDININTLDIKYVWENEYGNELKNSFGTISGYNDSKLDYLSISGVKVG